MLTVAKARPQPMALLRGTTLKELETAIRRSWNRDTAHSWDGWLKDNPATGQCLVTALVVQDYFGGTIMQGNVYSDGKKIGKHLWNKMDNGDTVDLTWEQFPAGATIRDETPGRSKEHYLSMKSVAIRYRRLSGEVSASLGDAC